MWSIVAMRNSLVFHDGDKITTLMMHASPALSAWWVLCRMDGARRAGWLGARQALSADTRQLHCTLMMCLLELCISRQTHSCMRWPVLATQHD